MKTIHSIKEIQAMDMALLHFYDVSQRSFLQQDSTDDTVPKITPKLTILDSGFIVTGNFFEPFVDDLFDYKKMLDFICNGFFSFPGVYEIALKNAIKSPDKLFQKICSDEFFELCNLNALSDSPQYMQRPTISGEIFESFWAFDESEKYRVISLQVAQN